MIGIGEEYWFMFLIAGIWTAFAVVQDFKTTEISNWLNFSLVAVVLGYRAFYSIVFSDLNFFVLGVLGFAMFFVIAYGFYYGKMFGGGDTKLLMGYGAILPYGSYLGVLIIGLSFIVLLLGAGAVYSLVYSVFLVAKQKKRFVKEWKRRWAKSRILIHFIIGAGVALGVVGEWEIGVMLLGLGALWLYVKSLDVCMVRLKKPGELQEGDWLEKRVSFKINGKKKKVEKSVHGLSLADIRMLKRAGKSVYVKEGVPFAIAFLLALGFMVFYGKALFDGLSVFL